MVMILDPEAVPEGWEVTRYARGAQMVGTGLTDAVEPAGRLAAIWATTFNFPFPASKTSASILSRNVVINASIPLFAFSTINDFAGASGP